METTSDLTDSLPVARERRGDGESGEDKQPGYHVTLTLLNFILLLSTRLLQVLEEEKGELTLLEMKHSCGLAVSEEAALL